jgi:hypothetical protein
MTPLLGQPARLGAALLVVVTALALSLFTPVHASAAVDDVPEVRVKVRSITLDGYTGNVVVVARVKCTPVVDGVGSASWSVQAVQELRAKASAPIVCDGERRRSVLQLDPKNGRFHRGTVNLTLTQTAAGSQAVEIQSTSFSTEV